MSSIFGSRLRQQREKMQLSQEDVARKLGVDRVSVTRYEGGRIPPGDTLTKLADILNVSTDYLLGRTAQPAAAPPAPARSPRLAQAFEQLLRRFKIRSSGAAVLHASGALAAPEVDRLRAGESPAFLTEDQQVNFFRKFDQRDVRDYYRAAGLELPPALADLAEQLREIGRVMEAHGAWDDEAIAWAITMLREGAEGK